MEKYNVKKGEGTIKIQRALRIQRIIRSRV